MAINVSALGSVPESEIPSAYTQEQSTALNEIFDQIESLIAGSAQMNSTEFNNLNSTILTYSQEQQQPLILLMQDTWNLTAGTAQMSDQEFIDLKLKYHPNTIISIDPPAEKNLTEEPEEPIEEPEEELGDEQSASPEPEPQNLLDNTSQTQDLTIKEQDKTIILNSEKNSNIYTSEAKTRLWVIYGFMIFAAIIIVLLALRKL